MIRTIFRDVIKSTKNVSIGKNTSKYYSCILFGWIVSNFNNEVNYCDYWVLLIYSWILPQ